MSHDRLADSIIAALVALKDGHDQLEQVLLGGALLHRVNLGKSLLKDPGDDLTSLAIDEDHPLVNQELFGLELDLDSFEHLDSLDDQGQLVLGHCPPIHLVEKQILLQGTFDLCGKSDAHRDEPGALDHEAGVV